MAPFALGSATNGDLAPQELSAKEKIAIERLAIAFLEKYDAPGLSVAFAKDGRIVYSGAFGLADSDHDTPLTARHRFRVASVSKPITSVTIMRLLEEGKLSLADRVFGTGGILGRTFGAQPYGAHVEEITLEHLLTHTAGGWGNGGPDPDPMFSNRRMNHSELISWTLDTIPIRNKPGEKFAYSNFGYCVLGRVIEKLTGVSYADAVRAKVLHPCGINSMEIAGDRLEDRKPMEVVYSGQEGEDPYRMKVARMDAHGGWIATASDLVRFLLRVDGYPTVPDILKPETVTVMSTTSAANIGYAKGWMVNKQDNRWHNGSLPGTATVIVRTSGGLCWAGLTNTRRPRSKIDLDLDRLMWKMLGEMKNEK